MHHAGGCVTPRTRAASTPRASYAGRLRRAGPHCDEAAPGPRPRAARRATPGTPRRDGRWPSRGGGGTGEPRRSQSRAQGRRRVNQASPRAGRGPGVGAGCRGHAGGGRARTAQAPRRTRRQELRRCRAGGCSRAHA
jgi:hypothetical protein